MKIAEICKKQTKKKKLKLFIGFFIIGICHLNILKDPDTLDPVCNHSLVHTVHIFAHHVKNVELRC